jgi:8-oxo-dGTP pyrophosphatase MutT (NUDIX family)
MADLPRPAATVIVLRERPDGPEVFLVRRHWAIAFMAGAYVFPGGRVEPSDRETADSLWCDGVDEAGRRLNDVDPAEAVGWHVAALRELFEETGVFLGRDRQHQFLSLADPSERDRFASHRDAVHSGARTFRSVVEGEGLRLALDALEYVSHWVTPPIEVRRFDTRFFVTRVPPNQTPVHDGTESTDSLWTTPRAALLAAARREIRLPPPTWITLREIERFRSVDEVLSWAAARRVQRRQPDLRERDGVRMLVMPGDADHPDTFDEPVSYETRYLWQDDHWRPA